MLLYMHVKTSAADLTWPNDSEYVDCELLIKV